MPNWCSIDLKITGPEKDLISFKEKAKGEGLIDANKFIPYPEQFKKLDEEAAAVNKRIMETGENIPFMQDGYNSGGYNWCVDNWGTKWNLCDVELKIEKKNVLKYVFDTAWSPPLPLIEKMSEMFPTLTFHISYYEAGMGFKGKATFLNNSMIEESYGSYSGNRGG